MLTVSENFPARFYSCRDVDMKRSFLPACLAAGLIAAFSASAVQAGVHVDFLFGGGHYYHHHHHPHYRYWADYYWYAPPPAVRYVPIAPAPVVYVPTATAPSVVAPVAAVPTTSLQTPTPTLAPSTQTAAAPNLPNNPVPSRTAARETSSAVRSTVSIANPGGSGGQVSFIVDGDREITLAPGETKILDDGESYVVEFDRGESFGTTKLTLNDGSYEFAVTTSGWDLQRRSSVALKPSVRRNSLPSMQR